MATASSSLAENLEQHLECAVCLEQYKEPKVLPCLHFFCKGCIKGLLSLREGVWRVVCPACRKETEIPGGLIDSLPSNFFVNNLLDVMAAHGDSQQAKQECGNCDSGDHPVTHCATCAQFLCEFCTAAHRRGRSTKAHALAPLDDVSRAVRKPALCSKHRGEILNYFCDTCDEAICRECPIVDHQGHRYVNLTDAFTKSKEDVLKILDEAKAKEIALNQAVDSVTETMKCLDTGAENALREVQDCFDGLVQAIHERRQELTRKVDELIRSKKTGLQVQRDELNATLGIVQSGVEFTERAFQDGSQVDVLNMKKQMITRLKDLSSMTWHVHSNASHTVEFKKDDKFKNIALEISKLGSIVSKTSASSAPQISVTVTMDNGEEGALYNTLCGQPVAFTLTTKDPNGRKRDTGSDPFNILIHGTRGDEFTPEIRDCGNGTYRFTYTPVEVGQYKLAVSLGFQPVEGSPFKWNCEAWNLTEVFPGDTQSVKFSKDNLKVSLELLGENSNNNNKAIIGSLGFASNQHLWKCRVTFRYTNSFALGVVASGLRQSGNFSCSRGRQWTWFPGKKYQPDMYDCCDSSLVNVKTNDVFELYLDRNTSKLSIHNQRTGERDTLYGFRDDVFPVFHLWRAGSAISLTL